MERFGGQSRVRRVIYLYLFSFLFLFLYYFTFKKLKSCVSFFHCFFSFVHFILLIRL